MLNLRHLRNQRFKRAALLAHCIFYRHLIQHALPQLLHLSQQLFLPHPCLLHLPLVFSNEFCFSHPSKMLDLIECFV